MKKLIFLSCLIYSLVAGFSVSGQSSACGYTTCIPVIPFKTTDALQQYGVLLKIASVVGSGTATSSGSVVVTGSVSVVNSQTANVGGFTAKVTQTLNVDGSYSIGDCVGGVVSFTDAMRTTGGGDVSQKLNTGVLTDMEIWDPTGQAAAYTIDFWSKSPTNSTFTDNAPVVLNPADSPNYLGYVTVSASDYVTRGSKSIATLTGLGLVLTGDLSIEGSRTVYMTVTAVTAPVFVSTQKIYFRLGILRD